MSERKREWCYIDERTGQQVGPLTLDELDEAHRAGAVEGYSHVHNVQMARQPEPMATGIPYSMISRVEVDFAPTVEEFCALREGKMTTVLSGPNNCGKTLLLKQLFLRVGHEGYLIACNRFSHIDVLNTRKVEDHEHRRYYDSFTRNYWMSQQNSEDNELKLEQVITSLKDRQREKLFGVCNDLLGNQFTLKRTDPENTFSPFFVDMDGENLRYGSSGTRLLLTLLGILLDERFTVILIDDPEIGLSPRVQAALATFLYDDKRRQQYCPHLRQVYVATHSHLFLDRDVLSNNHVVTKVGNAISLKPVVSVADYHQLQFNMLGNELEAISLPSAIVLVEGESDATFLAKVLQLHIPHRKVSVVRAEGEGEVLKKLHFFREAFGALATSPYRSRLFVLLDRRISVRTPRIEDQGVPRDNIVVLSQNGIEHYYPPELIAAAFRCAPEEVGDVELGRDPMEFHGIRKTKTELSKCVADALTEAHQLLPDVRGLIDRVRSACG